MVFIESRGFTRTIDQYLSHKGFLQLQIHLQASPLSGDLMPATGGFRKLRWADPRRGKGRRGGLRVIYSYFPEDEQIWLFMVYDKDEAADLTPNERKALREAMQQELGLRDQQRLTRRRPRSK